MDWGGPLRPTRAPDAAPEGWSLYTEADKVQEWRRDCLKRAGLDDITASILARTTNDLHLMEEAIRSGLTPEGALAVFT